MGKRDLSSKALLDNPEVVADLLNYLLFDGKRRIKAAHVHVMDSEQTVLVGRRVERRMRDRMRWISFMWKRRPVSFLFGIEIQAEVSHIMPVRVMLYDALGYMAEVEAVAARHKAARDLSEPSEFLSGVRALEKILGIVTAVVYFGKKPWEGSVALHGMLDTECAELKARIPNCFINLIDPHQMGNQELVKLRSELREIMAFIKYADNREQLLRFIHTYSKGRKISGIAVDVINDYTKAGIKRIAPKEKITMCQAAIDLRNEGELIGHRKGLKEGKKEGKKEGLKEGKKEGLKEGKKEGKKEGLKEGTEMTRLSNIRALAKTMHLSFEQAMIALRIPSKARPRLLEILNGGNPGDAKK